MTLSCKIFVRWCDGPIPQNTNVLFERPPDLFNWSYVSSYVSFPSAVEIVESSQDLRLLEAQMLLARQLHLDGGDLAGIEVPEVAHQLWVKLGLLLVESL